VPAAGLTPEADVSAEPVDEPGVTTARMASTEADDIAQQQLEDGSS